MVVTSALSTILDTHWSSVVTTAKPFIFDAPPGIVDSIRRYSRAICVANISTGRNADTQSLTIEGSESYDSFRLYIGVNQAYTAWSIFNDVRKVLYDYLKTHSDEYKQVRFAKVHNTVNRGKNIFSVTVYLDLTANVI